MISLSTVSLSERKAREKAWRKALEEAWRKAKEEARKAKEEASEGEAHQEGGLGGLSARHRRRL